MTAQVHIVGPHHVVAVFRRLTPILLNVAQLCVPRYTFDSAGKGPAMMARPIPVNPTVGVAAGRVAGQNPPLQAGEDSLVLRLDEFETSGRERVSALKPNRIHGLV